MSAQIDLDTQIDNWVNWKLTELADGDVCFKNTSLFNEAITEGMSDQDFMKVARFIQDKDYTAIGELLTIRVTRYYESVAEGEIS